MDNNLNNNQFPNTSPVETANQNTKNTNNDGQQPAANSRTRATVFIILAAVILVLGGVLLTLFTQTPVPTSLGIDKNGVQIIELNKKQVTNRTADGKPLNEPEVHAVFRWAVEHPDEAARLSPEEKANIIRALNE